MTTREASKRIGCSIQHVRTLIRRGTIRATETYDSHGSMYYRVNAGDVKRYASKPQSGGFPRGQKRKGA